MRAIDRDLIRAGHYGQRPGVPHSKAEHMAAPTKGCKREESSCQLGAVHTWPIADIPSCTAHVRFRGESGRDDCNAECPLMTQSGHHVILVVTAPELIYFKTES